VFSFCRKVCVKGKGFTLIELLIVIAIILILISIALPNFLEAQVRAKVTATRGNLKSFETALHSFMLDNGDVYPDYNDYGQGELMLLVARLRAHINAKNGCASKERVCSCSSPALPRDKGGVTFVASESDFYAPGVHCPLTSPIAYMSKGSTTDPFGGGVVTHGYDSYPAYRGTKMTGHLAYGGVFGIGPDHIAGDWLRDTQYTIDTDKDGLKEGLPYNPTNGTTSHGDLWRVIAADLQTAKYHYNDRLSN
jgi:prepilin-type N-terminal cleavage/methylation domain-containing protein